VKTIIGTHTNLPNRFCVRNRIDEDPIHINNRDRSSNKISKELKEYIQKLRGKYKEAEPDYMKNDIQREEYKKMEIYDRIQTASQLLSKFFIMIEKKMRHYITTGMSRNPNIKMRILRKINRTYYRKKLRSRYETHVVEPDYSLNYLYFPLHYQPERTTSPEGGRFVHQYLAIDLLSSVLPNDTHIFVKEHPSQFSSRLQGEKGRSLQYYNHIRDIPKVSLVPLDSDPFELIDNSKAVATITGTAGWEALVRGKPAIIFGNAWYRSAPGCHHIDEIKGSANVVKDIINSEGVSRECINNFVSRAEEACYLGSLNSTSEGNVDALFDAVSDLM
jgi:hypothetical protein